MGKRGRPLTPTAILRLRGSWRAKTRDPREPTPQLGRPKMPATLTQEQRIIWRRLCRVLAGMGVLATSDPWQLERYCVYFTRWREMEAWLRKHGTSYPLKSRQPLSHHISDLGDGVYLVGFGEYPQVWEQHRLDRSLKQIEAQFGLTPSARAGIVATEKREANESPDVGLIDKRSG